MERSSTFGFFVLAMVFMFRFIDTAVVFETGNINSDGNRFDTADLAYQFHFKSKCYFLPYVRLNIWEVKKLVFILFFYPQF